MTSRFPTSHRGKRQDTDLHLIHLGVDDSNKMKKPTSFHSSWTLVLQRLLLKIRLKQDAILQTVVFLSAMMLVLKAKEGRGQLNRTSIAPQDLPHYYRSYPLVITYDDPLQNEARAVHTYQTKRLIKEWTKVDAQQQKDLWNDKRYVIASRTSRKTTILASCQGN